MAEHDLGSESIIRAEHIGTQTTGDNIDAKKVANYVWNNGNSQWERQTTGGGGVASDVNVADIGGNATDTNSGLKSAGTLRVVVATDQPQLTNALKVDGTGGAFPVSGTVTANAGTNLNTSSLATSTNITGGGQKSQIVDGTGNVIGATSNALDINIKSGNPTSITANAGTNLNTSALALESGGNLASIKAKTDNIPAQGQALAAGSLPVVLPAAQISTLTPLSTVAVTQSTSPWVVSNGGTFPVQTTPTPSTAIYNGKKTVTTAGTRVTLASSQAVKSVAIKALIGNTGTIYVGDGSVASTNGFALLPGETVSLDIANLATVNLDSSVSGEGVTYIASN